MTLDDLIQAARDNAKRRDAQNRERARETAALAGMGDASVVRVSDDHRMAQEAASAAAAGRVAGGTVEGAQRAGEGAWDVTPKAIKRLLEELDTLGHCAARHGWLASGDHCREAVGVITTLRAALARVEGERDNAQASERASQEAAAGWREDLVRVEAELRRTGLCLTDALVVFDIGQEGSARFHAAYRDVIDHALRAQGGGDAEAG